MKDNRSIAFRIAPLNWWILVVLMAPALQLKASRVWSDPHITTIYGEIQPGSRLDTLVFSYLRNYLYNIVGEEETVVHCDKKGRFRFTLTDAASIGRIAIIVKGSTPGHFLHHYLQNGDSIRLDIKRSPRGLGFNFSGRGSVKFIAKQQLDSVSAGGVANMNSIPELDIRIQRSQADRLLTIFKRLDYVGKLQLDFFVHMQPKLSAEIYELMRCDVTSYALERKYFNYWFFMQRNKGKPESVQLEKMFYELEASARMPTDQPLLRISKNYVELLLRMAAVRDLAYGDLGLQQTYRLVKYGSPLSVRDRAVTSYLLSNPKLAQAGVYEQCIRDALASVTDNLDKKVITQLLTAYQKGSAVFDFELIKSDGSVFRSEELKGKGDVVLIDFWFKGCTACIKQADEFNLKIMPKIKADKMRVTILSVNLDKKIQDWKQSLASGKYSIEGSVELFTGGLAFKHPLAQFYQIQGCPRLLVFDPHGRLVASDPKLGSLLTLVNQLLEK